MSDIATPRRRSARLQANNNNNTPGRTRNVTPARKRLASVLEDDEVSTHAAHLTDKDLTATPLAKRQMPGSFDADVETMKTPESARPPKPAREEMHPAHAHQNTVRVSNTGLDLGFSDVNPYQSSPLRSSFNSDAFSPPPVSQARSPAAFEFTFNQHRRDLSEEAQRIIDNVREEAAIIREDMRKERDEQARKDLEAGGITDRRFAKPKSRFSDAHQAEFDKMPSIADRHMALKRRQQLSSPAKEASTAAAGLSSPVGKLPQTPTRTGLKRSRSKVDLDDGDKDKDSVVHTPSKTVLKTPTKLLSPSKLPSFGISRQAGASVSKRRKVDETQDVSHVRPSSSGAISSVAPTSPQKPGISSAISTPTKATLARTQAAKKKTPGSEKSKFGLSRASPVKNGTKPGGLRAASDRIASGVVSRINAVKSILHKPQPKYSDDPLKIAAGTHIPVPRQTPSVNEGTPSLPGTPHVKHTLPRPTPKRVEFAPDTKGASDHVVSPSPAKKPSVRLLPPNTDNGNDSGSSSLPKSPLSKTATVAYPVLPEPPTASVSKANDLTQSPTPRQALSPLFSHPTAGNFTFSHDKRIVFASEPPTPQRQTLAVPASGTSTPTSVRQIRASPGMPTPSFQPPRIGNTPKQIAHALNALPAVPHGMTNKKRARSSTDDNGGGGSSSSDIENRDPNESMLSAAGEGSPRKRAKMAAGVSYGGGVTTPSKSPAPASVKRTPISVRAKLASRLSPAKSSPIKTPQRRQTGFGLTVPATSPRKGLSLSRINMLARPKQR